MQARLDPFLELGNASLDRLKHLVCLCSSVAEDQNPAVLAELFPQSLRIGLQHFVALHQLISPVFQLLAGTGENALSPGLEHGQSHGQEI
jgi:hypothetical protein